MSIFIILQWRFNSDVNLCWFHLKSSYTAYCSILWVSLSIIITSMLFCNSQFNHVFLKERIEWNSLIIPITLQNISYHSRSSTLCISNIKLITTNTFASFSVYISKHALSFRFFFKSAKYAFWLILIPKTCTFFIQFMLTNRRSFNSFTHTFRFAKTFSIKNVWNRRLFDRTFGIRQTPDSLQIKQNLTFYSNKLILIQKNPFQIKTIETNLVFSGTSFTCKSSYRVIVVTKLD